MRNLNCSHWPLWNIDPHCLVLLLLLLLLLQLPSFVMFALKLCSVRLGLPDTLGFHCCCSCPLCPFLFLPFPFIPINVLVVVVLGFKNSSLSGVCEFVCVCINHLVIAVNWLMNFLRSKSCWVCFFVMTLFEWCFWTEKEKKLNN